MSFQSKVAMPLLLVVVWTLGLVGAAEQQDQAHEARTTSTLSLHIHPLSFLLGILVFHYVTYNVMQRNPDVEALQAWHDKTVALLRNIEVLAQHWMDVSELHVALYWKVFMKGREAGEHDDTVRTAMFNHYTFIRMQSAYLAVYPSLEQGLESLDHWFCRTVSNNPVLQHEETGRMVASLYIPPVVLQPMLQDAQRYMRDLDEVTEDGKAILLRCLGGRPRDTQAILDQALFHNLQHVHHILQTAIQQQTFASAPAWHRDVYVPADIECHVPASRFQDDVAIIQSIRKRLQAIFPEFLQRTSRAAASGRIFWCMCCCQRRCRQSQYWVCCPWNDAGFLQWACKPAQVRFRFIRQGVYNDSEPKVLQAPLKSLSVKHLYDALSSVALQAPEDFPLPTKHQFLLTARQLRAAYLEWHETKNPSRVDMIAVDTIDAKYRTGLPWRMSLSVFGFRGFKSPQPQKPQIIFELDISYWNEE